MDVTRKRRAGAGFRRRLGHRLLVTVVAGSLAACDGSADEVKPRNYSSLSDIEDAITASGIRCDYWIVPESALYGDENARCGDDVFVGIFAYKYDIEEEAAAAKELEESFYEVMNSDDYYLEYVFGPNWVIVGSDVKPFHQRLGGDWRTFGNVDTRTEAPGYSIDE